MFKRAHSEDNEFQKEKNEINNKRTAGNQLKMLKNAIFVKKLWKINVLKVKNIVKLALTAIMQVNKEVLHVV